jgi:arabinose-5-phosphate isomerase
VNYLEKAKETIDLEIAGLKMLKDGLDGGFSDAVEMILACLADKNKIVVTGIGKNLHIAEKISATLASTGSTSVVLNPVQAMHGDLGILHKGDTLLALSYSGESDEILALLPIIKRAGVKIIAMTGVTDSTLAKLSDVIIPVTIETEACPFNMAPTTSTTASLAAGDALAMVLIDASGFQKEDYAKLHPSGAIGRALLMKVADIMRPIDRMAIVDECATVKTALLAMTEARVGSACVIDSKNKVVGIFTDGDLRRHISKTDNLLSLTIKDVMTAEPLTVSSDKLAADVLAVFEEQKIDDLIVVDNNNEPIGSIDIQDLPKLKIL